MEKLSNELESQIYDTVCQKRKEDCEKYMEKTLVTKLELSQIVSSGKGWFIGVMIAGFIALIGTNFWQEHHVNTVNNNATRAREIAVQNQDAKTEIDTIIKYLKKR